MIGAEWDQYNNHHKIISGIKYQNNNKTKEHILQHVIHTIYIIYNYYVGFSVTELHNFVTENLIY